MLTPNDFTCRADQNKQKVKSHIKGSGNTAFGLHTVQSHTHTHICTYVHVCLRRLCITINLKSDRLILIERKS